MFGEYITMSLQKPMSLAQRIQQTTISDLPAIQYIQDPEVTTVSHVEQNPHALLSILSAGRDEASLLKLKLADLWYGVKIQISDVPFGKEIVAAASVAKGVAGTIALNFCYDIACSTGIYLTKEGRPSLIRTLDWDLKMAPLTIALTRKGTGGNWIDITYPGFAGTVTALGPHFSAAINRAPMRRRFSKIKDAAKTPNYKPPFIDRTLSFFQTLCSSDISPVHLLRQAFEECTSFDGAVHKIATTKTNCPVIIPIAGTKEDEAAIIFKDGDFCTVATFSEGVSGLSNLFKDNAHVTIVEEEFLAATNHWPEGYGMPDEHQRRNSNSEGRRLSLIKVLQGAKIGNVFDLFQLSEKETGGKSIVPSTVLAAELTPATGMLKGVTMESLQLAQKPFEIYL